LKESQARDEICRVGASLFASGYVHATAGNISVRLSPDDGGGFLITPTGACLGSLDLEELEETTKLWLLSGRTAAHLTKEAIAELRQAFGAAS
jgi:ribulose-5-phosphate 4-epimerase/fuculose-1-phosphate aldolase